MIELPSPDQPSARFHTYAPHARALVPTPEGTSHSAKQFLIEFRLFRAKLENRPTFCADEILARNSAKNRSSGR
jgi:hypothetical protein